MCTKVTSKKLKKYNTKLGIVDASAGKAKG